MAASLELPLILESANIAAGGGNLEEAGREARRAFFQRIISDRLVDRVCTGHTRSDQAETVLYRLLRGSGTAGLAGVLPVTRQGLVRPLLWCTRTDIETYLNERSIPWREDRTNADVAYDRNRIRRQLLPLLRRDYNSGVEGILAGTATVAQDEERYWAGEIDSVAARSLRMKNGAALMNVGDISRMPPAVARRLVRRAIEMVKGDLRSVDVLHVEQILLLAASPDGSGRLQAPGIDVFRSFEWLRIGTPRTTTREERDYEMGLGLPDAVAVPGQDLRLCLDVIERQDVPPDDGAGTGYNTVVKLLDRDRVDGSLRLRNWRPGDQLATEGHSSEKIKTFFQRERIPIWERQGWPVITSDDRIVWARRFGIASDCAPGPQTRRFLRIIESESSD
jgi:tRNA(Ile)-lysidine synthase